MAENIGYPTPNLAAQKLLPKSYHKDSSLYPSEEIISKGEWQNDVGEGRFYTKAITKN